MIPEGTSHRQGLIGNLHFSQPIVVPSRNVPFASIIMVRMNRSALQTFLYRGLCPGHSISELPIETSSAVAL